MAFNGHLIKFGGTVLPNKFIRPESFVATPNQRMEIDAWRDGNGMLHRETYPATKTKIEWETPALNLAAKQQLQAIINAAVSVAIERKVSVTYWNDEVNDYKTMTAYLPDIQFTVRTITATDIWYNPIRFALVEY